MTTRKRCFDNAAKHGAVIDYEKTWTVHVGVPDGYSIYEEDDQEGYTTDIKYLKMSEVWRYVWEDLHTLVAQKPWYKKPEED
jgi:hypothetical protein